MQKQGLYVCLSVIGGDPELSEEALTSEMARLQGIREQYGLSELVTFLGKRGQDTLPYYYSAAEAVVVPSYYESFGMVALEAMACGTPVVASQVGGLAFLVQDGITGFTVPFDEPQKLAEYLTTLIIDHELRQKMGKQAAAFAMDYGWGNISQKVLDLYEELI